MDMNSVVGPIIQVSGMIVTVKLEDVTDFHMFCRDVHIVIIESYV
jgi:hypothetical protein